MPNREDNLDRSGLPPVVYRRGVHLQGTLLWCDALDRKDLCFVSSPLVSRPGQHRQTLCSEEAAQIIRARGGALRALQGPYGQRLKLGPLLLELLPAGYVRGAAQVLVHHRHARVLYTGPICTEKLPTAPAAALPSADLAVVTARCVPPKRRVPARDVAARRLLSFVDDALSAGDTPVLLVDPLGQGQDVLSLVGAAGYRVRAHRTLYRNALAYRSLGERFRGIRRFQGTAEEGDVVVCPRAARQAGVLRRLARPRVAIVDQEAEAVADDETVIRYGNLSTCAQVADWVVTVAPQRVLLVGPQEGALAEALAGRVPEVRVISGMGQLDLL